MLGHMGISPIIACNTPIKKTIRIQLRPNNVLHAFNYYIRHATHETYRYNFRFLKPRNEK